MKSLLFIFSFLSLISAYGKDGVSVLKYLPKNAKLDGSVDYRKQIQKAINENQAVFFPGSNTPDSPFIYGIKTDGKTGLKIPAGHILSGSKNSILRRLPSKGALIRTEIDVVISGLVIDGNKKAHWPTFKDLGKHDTGIYFSSRNIINKCRISNNPGTAFATTSDDSLVIKCKATNSGYIDMRFKADYYQGKWDKWSGDSFYIRGHRNKVIDCESQDAFRWDYTTCHKKAGKSLFVNCTGKDMMWKTYGFIDIEGCDGGGSTLVNCKSPDGSLVISTSGSEAIDCSSKLINVYSADNIKLIACETFGSGLAIGGWSSSKNTFIAGGASPIVIGNIVNRDSAGPGVPQTSDWSLSVFSTNGKGLVLGNYLNDYRNGPGMKFDKVAAFNNKRKTGKYKVPVDSAIQEIKNKQDNKLARERKLHFIEKLPEIVTKQGIKGKIAVRVLARENVQFKKDKKNIGVKSHWYMPKKVPSGLQPIKIGRHWDSQIGKYHNTGWYFISMPFDMDDQHITDSVYMIFEGVDSECEVFFNGSLIGRHKGWKDSFYFRLPKAKIKWEGNENPNLLVVKVYTPGGVGGIYGNIAAIMTRKGEKK